MSSEDVEFTMARARVYGLLAAAYDGDMTALADALERDAFARLADLLPVALDPVQATDPDPERLEIGYDNLFVVPGPYFVPPFASAHAAEPSEDASSDSIFHKPGTEGELLGEPAAWFAHRYAQVGFSPVRGDGIPDHLAAVFEFMQTLAAREADHRRTGDTETAEDLQALQREVVGQLGWLDAFDDRLAASDRAEGVFASLATFTRAFVAWDARDALAAE